MNKLFEQYKEALQSNIESAQCLPFAVYHDDEVYRLEVEQAYRSHWVMLCAQSQLREPGDYMALTLADEPVAVVRSKDGNLNALSNVCRHRGTPLLDEGFGNIEGNIVCPYHAWTYDDEGQFKGAPFTGEVKIDKNRHCLPRFKLTIWCGLIFVNLNADAEPLSHYLAGLDELLRVFELENFKYGYEGQTQRWQANWKLIVENAIESYHLFKVHQQTLELYTPTRDSFYVAGGSRYSVSAGKFKDTGSKWMKWLSGGYPEIFDHYVLFFVPPGFIVILTYGSLDWVSILPDGPEKTQIFSGGVYTQAGQADKAQMNFTEAFMQEDKLMVERVHKGMKSPSGKGGKLVSLEQPLVDFRHFLAARLFDFEPPEHKISDKAAMLTKDV